jgi:mannose-6-phosphate isomerase-like protein (cupin superfamily)
MSYTVFRPEELQFGPPKHGDQSRGISPLSEAMREMRANIWRLPPGVRGTRHLEHAQEEVFVVLQGSVTMLLGDPAERVDLAQGSVVVVGTDTGQQLRNEGDGEAVVLVVGAPPVTGQAEHLPDAD